MPAQETGFQVSGLVDEGAVNVCFYAYGDDAHDDEADDHYALDIVCYKGDFEAAERWILSAEPYRFIRC